MKIAFIFIVKDGEQYLERNLNLLKRHNQDIYAVENNSTDDTKNILKNSNIKQVTTLNLDKNHSLELCKNERINCTERVRRLAYIRQQGLNSVIASGINYDYVCMLDMDFVKYDENGLNDMFTYMEEHQDVDAIFGMSVQTLYGGIPYDTAAIKPLYKVLPIIFKFNRYVEVDSAFSGFGVYRFSSIYNTKATYDYQNITDIEHIQFNSNFNKLIVDTKFNPVYNPSYHISKPALVLIFIVLLILILPTK